MEKFEDLIKTDKPLLVDFFATWCGPCKMMHPILEDLAAKVGDKARIIKIDIDKNEQLASIYNVRSVPTLMIFRDGELKWRASGVHQSDQLESELEKYYVS
ncbi:MAG: thioredoxin [Candidatus Amulumruptor caecigallinarius]|nr:thioredoxin [Candidatus Amulumruptor caecigallinarius]